MSKGKRFLLSLLVFLLSGIMGLIILCPVVTFSQEVKIGDASTITELGQNAQPLHFVEAVFITEEKYQDLEIAVGREILERAGQVAEEKLTLEEAEEQALKSPLINKLQVFTYAEYDDLSPIGISEEGLGLETKLMGGFMLAFFIAGGLLIFINLLRLLGNSKLLRKISSFFAILAFLVATAMVVLSFFYKASSIAGTTTTTISGNGTYFLYILAGYTFLFLIVQSIINSKFKKI